MAVTAGVLHSGLDVTELFPGLWIGSAPPRGPGLARAFDTVVLCAAEWPPPGRNRAAFYPGIELLELPLLDGPMTPEVARAAEQMADRVARRVQAGRRVLVSCMAGRNRSGLVAALALARVGGMSRRAAAGAVRNARLNALTNPAFLDYLRSHGRLDG